MIRTIDFTRGVVSLAATVAFLIAVPWLLATQFGNPIIEIVDVVSDELASDATISQALLTNGLVSIVWIAWLQLSAAVLIETSALLRGRSARRASFMFPGIQLTARRLVASCALVLTAFTGTPLAAAAPSLTPIDPSEPVAQLLFVNAATPTIEALPEATAAAGPVYVTEARDTFWSVAEALLGDGLRWQEIRDMNLGADLGNGSTLDANTETLRAGVTLALPADAVLPLTTAEPAATPAAVLRVGDTGHNVIVGEGDHFWGLAERTLAQAWGRPPTDDEIRPFWVELVGLNRDVLVDYDDPNTVHPGQSFMLPEIPASADVAGHDLDRGGSNVVAFSAGAVDDRAETQAANEPADAAADAEPHIQAPASDETSVGAEAARSIPEPVAPETDESSSGLDVDGSAESASELAAPSAGPVITPNGATPPVAAEPVPPPQAIPDDAGPSPIPAPSQPTEASTPATITPTDADTTPVEDADVGASDAPVVVITGIGLLTAAVAGVVARLRKRRLAERHPGRAPRFRRSQQAEQLLSRTADPEGLDDVDAALRHMGTGLADINPPPSIVGVTLETDYINVLLAEPHPNPPAPFEVGPDQHSWRVGRHTPLDGAHDNSESPLPALVTVGHTHRAHLLLDLEHAGLVNVSGPADEVGQTMATMALELATSSIAELVEIVCVGLAPELDVFDRVHVVDDINEAREHIEAHGLVAGRLASESSMTPLQGRVTGTGGDAWAPMVVFAPNGADALTEFAQRDDTAGVVSLVAGNGSATWQMQVDGEQVQIPHLGITMRRRNLAAAERQAVCDLVSDAKSPETGEVTDLVATINDTVNDATVSEADLEASSEPLDLRTGAELWLTDTPTPPADELVPPTEFTPPPPKPGWDVDYVVEILGLVRVVDAAGDEIRFTRRSCPDMVAFLAHHRRGATVDTTMEALWPNAEPNKRRINNVASSVRSALGTSSNDEPYLAKVGIDGTYRLSDRVGCDYERFKDLVGYAARCEPATASESLREALELVSGDPFGGTGGSDWAYQRGFYTDVVLAIDEAARTMATLALDTLDDPASARWATTQGLAANPRSTELHLLRLRAALARGDAGLEPDAVFQQYCAAMEQDESLPEADSMLDPRIVELYEAYRRERPGVWASQAKAG